MTLSPPSKPFYLSSGFLTSAVSAAVTLLAGSADMLSPEVTAILMSVISSAYMISRGIGKIGPKFDSKAKPFYKTSEFWVMVLGAVTAGASYLEGALPPDMAVKVSGALTSVYTLSRRISMVGDPNEDEVDAMKKLTLDELVKRIKDENKP